MSHHAEILFERCLAVEIVKFYRLEEVMHRITFQGCCNCKDWLVFDLLVVLVQSTRGRALAHNENVASLWPKSHGFESWKQPLCKAGSLTGLGSPLTRIGYKQGQNSGYILHNALGDTIFLIVRKRKKTSQIGIGRTSNRYRKSLKSALGV